MSNKNIALTETPSLVPGFLGSDVPAAMPDFARSDAGAGGENVSGDEMSTPQLKIGQPLSPEVIEEKISAGKLFNSVSLEQFDELYVVNIFFERKWTIFYQRKSGKKGVVEDFKTEQEAIDFVEGHAEKSILEIQDTHIHTGVALDAEGIAFPFRLFLKATGLGVSRNWNTMLEQQNKGMARFFTVWKLTPEKKSNSHGMWYVPKIEFAGTLAGAETIYNNVKAIYESIKPKASA